MVTCGVKTLASFGWPSFFVTWGRFAFGLFVVSSWFLYKKSWPKANRFKWVAIRALFNFVAVSFYYLSVYLTSLAKANLLNMTYPIFVALLAPAVLKEKTSRRQFVAVAISFLGILCVLGTQTESWSAGDLYGLLCGFLAAFSILSLRAARATESSDTILFYVMLFGFLGLSPFLELPQSQVPVEWLLFFITSAGGLLGQYFLTMAYKNIQALQGAIASSTRIIFSAILGWLLFQEAVSASFLLGSSLIIYGIYMNQKKVNKTSA